jgi:hypothetical protein
LEEIVELVVAKPSVGSNGDLDPLGQGFPQSLEHRALMVIAHSLEGRFPGRDMMDVLVPTRLPSLRTTCAIRAEATCAWDTEGHFRALAATGNVQQALAILDRLNAEDRDVSR